MAANYADTILILKKENNLLKAHISTTDSEIEKNKTFMTQEEIDRAKSMAS